MKKMWKINKSESLCEGVTVQPLPSQGRQNNGWVYWVSGEIEKEGKIKKK